MDVINIFRSFFSGIGGFLEFMNTEIFLGNLNGMPVSITPMTALGLGIGVVLTLTFSLHLMHLLNPVG